MVDNPPIYVYQSNQKKVRGYSAHVKSLICELIIDHMRSRGIKLANVKNGLAE